MKSGKGVYILIIIIVSVILGPAVCGCGASYISSIDPIAARGGDSGFNDRALFIAGLDRGGDSPYCQYTAAGAYKNYQRHIDRVWNGFLLENMRISRAWRDTYIGSKYSDTLFYPFSGPDILHPLTFYPDARDIVMFGLEEVGRIPDVAGITAVNRAQGLWGLARALDFTMKHSFFVTADMERFVGNHQYTGITSVMMFFLARAGYEIVDVKYVWIDGEGRIVFSGQQDARSLIPGVEIIFRKGGERLRRVRFFRIDVSNWSPKLPRFIAYLRNYPPFTTIIKSASYLMYDEKGFGQIRDAVLEMSNSVLLDDSGMPLSAFDEKIWRIRYHGYYHDPIPAFTRHRQDDLRKRLDKLSTGPLPFAYGYGYGYGDMQYHLLHAVKISPSRTNKKGPPEQ